MAIFAISDIHGCLQSFIHLLDKIQFSTSDTLYLLGDFTDRGPASKQVINYIQQLLEEHQVLPLRGNHDQMMLDARQNLATRRLWSRHGGIATLDSFDAASMEEIPGPYFDFLDQLSYY